MIAEFCNREMMAALGAIQNNDGRTNRLYGSGTALGQFDKYDAGLADVLVKYTFQGDTNLNGIVDGGDYSRADNGYLQSLTGWFNGDFNYDGNTNGSDYTLLDNAFNTQGASLAAIVSGTGSVASPAIVPEACDSSVFKKRRLHADRVGLFSQLEIDAKL